MADGGEEIEVVNEVEFLDQKLSEAQKFDLYRDLQGYRCLWETSNVDYKNRELKEKALEDLSQKFNLTQSFLKRQLHTLRTALVRELKKENEGQQSKWKLIEYYDTLRVHEGRRRHKKAVEHFEDHFQPRGEERRRKQGQWSRCHSGFCPPADFVPPDQIR